MSNCNGGDENGVNRRDALKTFGFWMISGIAAAIVAVPGVKFIIGNSQVPQEPQWVEAGSVTNLPAPGKFIPVRYSVFAKDAWREVKREGLVWLGSSNDGQAYALSATCPHLGCLVRWQDDEGLFLCPCHTGKFDAEGKVISGPPPGPLQRLDLMVDNDRLMVKV